jgi:hemolysin III
MDAAALVDLRLDDGGPVYAETLPLDTLADRIIAEPWNAGTAVLFLALAAWGWLRLGRSGRHDGFLVWALPLLAVGGVGGTVYHATRAHHAWLLLDAMPIVGLVLGASVVLWRRLLGGRWWMAFGTAILALLGVRWAVTAGGGAMPNHLAAMLGYAILATLILVPLIWYLQRNRWRGASLIAGAVAAFIIAIACRTGDAFAGTWCGAGLHAAWHLAGLAACHLLIAFFAADARRDGPRPLAV